MYDLNKVESKVQYLPLIRRSIKVAQHGNTQVKSKYRDNIEQQFNVVLALKHRRVLIYFVVNKKIWYKE